MASNDDAILQFCAITGAPVEQATAYLSACNGNMEAAINSFMADQDEPSDDVPSSSSQPATEPSYNGPRTLDGQPAPQAAASSSSASKKPQKRTGLATLSSLGGTSSHHGHDHDDDDNEEDSQRRPRDLFAGGEKSGLAVQDPAQQSSDPMKLIDEIVAQAKANAQRSRDEASGASSSSHPTSFRGTGQTLGGDGVESRAIPDPSGPASGVPQSSEPLQQRSLHIWQDGFSIDDGPLRRFDDPANRNDLAMIQRGQAPLHLMNVRLDQKVDVQLQQHNEPYRQLPRIYRPFGGEGRRLGSPVPGEGSASANVSESLPAAAATPNTQASVASIDPTSTGVDESQPTLVLRIQLPDGTRLPARFNPTQTLGDVYHFVSRSACLANAGERQWVVATTFPNKDHTDRNSVLGVMPEFKKGGTAVVKWL